jgi:hypothetical protein
MKIFFLGSEVFANKRGGKFHRDEAMLLIRLANGGEAGRALVIKKD